MIIVIIRIYIIIIMLKIIIMIIKLANNHKVGSVVIQ